MSLVVFPRLVPIAHPADSHGNAYYQRQQENGRQNSCNDDPDEGCCADGGSIKYAQPIRAPNDVAWNARCTLSWTGVTLGAEWILTRHYASVVSQDESFCTHSTDDVPLT